MGGAYGAGRVNAGRWVGSGARVYALSLAAGLVGLANRGSIKSQYFVSPRHPTLGEVPACQVASLDDGQRSFPGTGVF